MTIEDAVRTYAERRCPFCGKAVDECAAQLRREEQRQRERPKEDQTGRENGGEDDDLDV